MRARKWLTTAAVGATIVGLQFPLAVEFVAYLHWDKRPIRNWFLDRKNNRMLLVEDIRPGENAVYVEGGYVGSDRVVRLRPDLSMAPEHKDPSGSSGSNYFGGAVRAFTVTAAPPKAAFHIRNHDRPSRPNLDIEGGRLTFVYDREPCLGPYPVYGECTSGARKIGADLRLTYSSGFDNRVVGSAHSFTGGNKSLSNPPNAKSSDAYRERPNEAGGPQHTLGPIRHFPLGVQVLLGTALIGVSLVGFLIATKRFFNGGYGGTFAICAFSGAVGFVLGLMIIVGALVAL